MHSSLARRMLAALALVVPAAPAAQAAHFSIIANVPGGPQIGAMKGNVLYGTLPNSGAGGSGELFSLTTSGTYTLLHTFNGATDGSNPNARLAKDSAGDIYGTASGGGANGEGTLWEYSAAGVMTTPHSFGSGTDGTYPYQGPTLGAGGTIIGATSQGAIGGSGNLFSLSHKGSYSVLYKFLSQGDGHCPFSGVAFGSTGAIYGTTVGLGFGGNPTGSVFQFTKTGGLNTLYVFQDGADGEWPKQAPVVDSAGNVYGTTNVQNGGNFAGAIWTISAAGKFSVLHSMNGATDGYFPNSPLLLNTDGNLYGTTQSGGADNYGTVFEITPAGTFTVIHSFTAGTDGAQPTGNLVHGANGVVYGGTNYGTVFKIVP